MGFNSLKYLLSCIFSAGLTITLILSPGTVTADVPLDRIVAVVNDDVIMESELETKLRTVVNQLQENGTSLPPQSALEKQVLDRLIMNKLQLQMAANTGIRVDDETLNKTINNIAAQNNVSLSQFRQILESDGYNYEQFREDIRNEIIISRLRQRQVDNQISVTDREIKNYLANVEIQGTVENEYLISHILIATPPNAGEAEVEQTRLVANKVLEDLKAGRDFAEMAASISDGQQALEGGKLGWRKHNEIPTLFTEYVDDMEKGEISELIQSPSGFHIIELTDFRSSEKNIVQQTKARHILLKPNELATEEDIRIRLRQLKTRIEGGDDFAALAQAHSEDTVSAAEGGSLGWITPGDLVPKFEEKMDALQPGEVSEPFETQFGWHIVQVLERREYDNSEELRRSKARQAIRERKMEDAHQNWLRDLRSEAYVEYRIDDY